MLKEILVDQKLNGEDLHKNLIPIAACNPYKLKANFDTDSSGLNTDEIPGIKKYRLS